MPDRAVVLSRLHHERERLQALRADLSAVRGESEGGDLSELSVIDQHPADVGTETFQREADLSTLEQVEAELEDVDHALERLDEGSYGVCEACGRPIGDERLAVQPAARFCVEDQAAAEREARTGLP
ncbi:MAG TPA: TraR/DksA C4-type zinc finger protein [Acidimicrobiales bacterium]|nr:TraR/DksA C4-type zinc finger protein [Acidimicrobiales bacterium]